MGPARYQQARNRLPDRWCAEHGPAIREAGGVVAGHRHDQSRHRPCRQPACRHPWRAPASVHGRESLGWPVRRGCLLREPAHRGDRCRPGRTGSCRLACRSFVRAASRPGLPRHAGPARPGDRHGHGAGRVARAGGPHRHAQRHQLSNGFNARSTAEGPAVGRPLPRTRGPAHPTVFMGWSAGLRSVAGPRPWRAGQNPPRPPLRHHARKPEIVGRPVAARRRLRRLPGRGGRHDGACTDRRGLRRDPHQPAHRPLPGPGPARHRHGHWHGGESPTAGP